MELQHFSRERHLFSAWWSSHFASAHILVLVFLSEIMKYATRVLVCIIAVHKLREFLLKVCRFVIFFNTDATVFMSMRRNFFGDDTSH